MSSCRSIDGYLIVPMVAKRSVDLAPALVLGAQILFGALFGILGLALADPMVAMIKVLLEEKSDNAADDAAGTDGCRTVAPAQAGARSRSLVGTTSSRADPARRRPEP